MTNIEERDVEVSRLLRELEAVKFVREQWEKEACNYRAALEEAHHALTTLHGLTACDGIDAYPQALWDGCDANGAWDMFRESTWTIDESKTLETIDAALSGEGGDS